MQAFTLPIPAVARLSRMCPVQISFVINHDQLLHGGDRPKYVSVFNEGTYTLALQAWRMHARGRRSAMGCAARSPA